MSGAIRATRLSAIPCCYEPIIGAVSAQSSTQTRLGTKSTGATEKANCLGIRAASWPSLDSISDGDGRDLPAGASTHDGNGFGDPGVMQVKLHVGDKVRVGTRVGTITDIGTILIQVKTTEGRVRVVCPWELVKVLG